MAFSEREEKGNFSPRLVGIAEPEVAAMVCQALGKLLNSCSLIMVLEIDLK